MRKHLPLALVVLACQTLPVLADRSSSLIDPGSPGVLKQISPTAENVTVEAGPEVKIAAGPADYPGVVIKPSPEPVFDLSMFGHVQAQVTNTGTGPLGLTMRLDNEGNWKENPWNAEAVRIKPGESAMVKVFFGHSFGGKPAYPLKPERVSKIMFFTGKSKVGQSFRIDSLEAAGSPGEKPPVDPKAVRVAPKDGYLLGGGVTFDPAKQTVAQAGAQASLAPDGKSLQVSFSKAGQSVTIKPSQGLWDLREGHQVRVRLKNTGSSPARPSVRLESQPGPTDTATAAQSVAAGASVEIVASFIPTVPARIDDAAKPKPLPAPDTGTKFTSDAVRGITLMAGEGNAQQTLEVEAITLEAPPVELPDWVGQRPPVKGDWVQTFAEEFDGDTIDLSKWNIYSSNFWDKTSHFSKDNVLVKDGVARLRYEKKTGRHNDDPNGKETDYATGFLDTYGKWVQRYGYFEVRMKLPKAPGLWPAFWLMSDRGLAAGEQWKRADTGNGGMEFDIMEYLSRWGDHRFTTAFHWDGYGKNHKATGARVYTGHDKDGFITTGLLWLPGLAVIYNNGKEITRWESPRISNVPSDIMFTHVTGGWDNDRLDNAQLPADYVLDHVRCWQRKDLASDLDGVQSTQPTPAAPTQPEP